MAILSANLLVSLQAAERAFSRVEEVPARRAALVLGCSPLVANGRENAFFRYRMEAAAALWRAGKVEWLLVSGANPDRFYNEPEAMRRRLVELGVPSEQIVLDYAGLRTLDSVVRAREIFGVDDPIIVSQEFHNKRALYLAQHFGLEQAVALHAQGVGVARGFSTHLREQLARVKMLLDVHLLGVQPRFLGDPEPLGKGSPS
ncbi:MAG: ElyC/SanA/YdcF family protein [Verrucomicrobiota bacterium]